MENKKAFNLFARSLRIYGQLFNFVYPMKNLLKKLTFSFLTALIVFVSFAPNLLTVKAAKAAAAPAPSAAPTWYNSSFKDWYGKVYDPNNPSEIFGERYTAAQVQWVMYGLWAFLINSVTGPDNAGIVQCFLNNVVDISTCTAQLQKIVDASNKDSVAISNRAKNTNLASLVFADRPFSGISYVKEKVQNFSVVPVAHAAPTVGFGFGALAPIQSMWAAFRDISFGLFVIVAIVFSFMIMFRVKLSPQTVISVQSALPKIITALVLVTFSYAIAGFLIDLMYVVIGLVSLVAAQIFSFSIGFVGVGPSQYFNLMTLGQPFGLTINAGVFGLIAIFFAVFFLPLFILLLVTGGALVLTGVGSTVGLVILILDMILFIIAVIIAFWVGIKIIWSLLKAFVNIILLTIFAPIQIGLGTIIPSLGFGQWLRSYVSNLAVFVVTGALFLFSFLFIIEAIIIGFTGPSVPQGLAVTILKPILGVINPILPNIIGASAWPPLLNTGSSQWIALLFLGVSFVLFTLVPKANEIIQGLLSGKPFAYGSAIGEAFGGVGLAYEKTVGPGVAGIQKYNSEQMLMNLARMLNTAMGPGGKLEKLPSAIKEPVRQISNATPFKSRQ